MTTEDVFELAHSISDAKQRLEVKQPYHLNVIDELYINENGHSRILTKLLQYKSEEREYEILNSFLEYVSQELRSESFGGIKVCKPEITSEKERIDLWIRDKDCAIIFENKIYNAADQDAQLCRYIEKTIKSGYKENQIFVVYLSQNGEEPDAQSWGSYKDAFRYRYVNIFFRTHILIWLKEKVLPNIKLKENVLRSAIEQYIDYLEGIFDLRTQNKSLNMEMERIIIEKLGLDKKESNLEKVNLLQNKIDELSEVNNQLIRMKDKYYSLMRNTALAPYLQQWKVEVEKRYPGFNPCKVGNHIGLIVQFRGDEVNVRISEDTQLYCQIDKYEFDNEVLHDELIEAVNQILPRHSKKYCVWKYFDINDFDGVFNCFKEVMDLLLKG